VIVIFCIDSYSGEQGNENDRDGVKHVKGLKPAYTLYDYCFDLYPNDKCKSYINAKRPSPMHVFKEIHVIG
jgi:hypothetical protein